MKVTVSGSHLCPDTLYALNKLVEAKADIEFKNLSASLPDLKAYLAVRESEPAYEAVKAAAEAGLKGNAAFDAAFAALTDRLKAAGRELADNVKDTLIQNAYLVFKNGQA